MYFIRFCITGHIPAAIYIVLQVIGLYFVNSVYMHICRSDLPNEESLLHTHDNAAKNTKEHRISMKRERKKIEWMKRLM